MRILIYKRTHKGDPDSKGRFGTRDCMGRVREYVFDAVIGIGGIGREPAIQRISRKINWIGVGAQKHFLTGVPGAIVTFEHFILFEETGLDFWAIAPILAERMYAKHAPRFILKDKFSEAERAEISRVLKLAKNAPPSARVRLTRTRSECPSIALTVPAQTLKGSPNNMAVEFFQTLRLCTKPARQEAGKSECYELSIKALPGIGPRV